MATILSSDEIFATVSQRGRVMSSLRLSGITSLADILRAIGNEIRGLATIELRNSTQGWQRRHTIMFAA
jgi:hypothetical protein